MKRNYKLSASFICGDMMSLESDIKLLKKESIDYIHFDVMDGVFVPRYGLFPEIITQMRKLIKTPIDLHLMVSKPEEFIPTFIDAGLNQANDIIVIHAESTQHLDRVIKGIHQRGVKAGVALNPATPLAVLDYVLEDIDLVMLMAINPGIVGHKLIHGTFKKIVDLKQKLLDHPEIIIEIDGGVNFESAPKMLEAGANMLVCGTQTIYNQNLPLDKKIKALRQLLDSYKKVIT